MEKVGQLVNLVCLLVVVNLILVSLLM